MSSLKPAIWEKIKKEEREDKFDAQCEYCERHHVPLFVDRSDDECINCGKFLLDFYNLEECAKKHVTGCGHCNWSLCE